MRHPFFEFGAAYAADNFGPSGRLIRLYKGGGGGGDGGAAAMMAQNEAHFREQMKMMKEQADKKLPEPPKYDPQASAPNASRGDLAAAEDQARRDAARRRNMQSAVQGGETKLGGQRTLLG